MVGILQRGTFPRPDWEEEELETKYWNEDEDSPGGLLHRDQRSSRGTSEVGLELELGLEYFDDVTEKVTIESKDENDRDGEEEDGGALGVHPALLILVVNSVKYVGQQD